ncbi:hypothetical protein I350_05216, partial [Cryptococcus amylolentus CBS 6273]
RVQPRRFGVTPSSTHPDNDKTLLAVSYVDLKEDDNLKVIFSALFSFTRVR